MQHIGSLTEAEMVLEFLRAELRSPRFAERYQRWLIARDLAPDIDIATLTPEIRKELLWSARPGMFKSLPYPIEWSRVVLGADDVDHLYYMNEAVWRDFSNGTRLVKQGIEKINQPRHQVISRRVKEINQEIANGAVIPQIILISKPDQMKLVILEGHVRATAYAYANLFEKTGVTVILGTTPNADRWAWY